MNGLRKVFVPLECHACNALGTSDWFAVRSDALTGIVRAIGFMLTYPTLPALRLWHPNCNVLHFSGPPALYLPKLVFRWQEEEIPRVAIGFMLAYDSLDTLRAQHPGRQHLALDFRPAVAVDSGRDSDPKVSVHLINPGPPEQN